ncbi:MAG: hypothetical protein JRN71_07315 [Nitrososphaerota archaeon]|nr:hypothetical protein [Nitrososphaerota archaeon]
MVVHNEVPVHHQSAGKRFCCEPALRRLIGVLPSIGMLVNFAVDFDNAYDMTLAALRALAVAAAWTGGVGRGKEDCNVIRQLTLGPTSQPSACSRLPPF